MGRKVVNTPGGDRRRDRAVRRGRVAKPMEGNHLRVRSKRLDEVYEDKLSLAFWLLAKRLVEDQTDGAPGDPASGGETLDEPDEAAGAPRP